MFYFCIAEGMADCSPTTQDYHACRTIEDVRDVVFDACTLFDNLEAGADNEEPYKYALREPREGEDNYSQRLRISKGADCVLDIIGMTEGEYLREAGEGEDLANEGGL